ncbi:hypothetical protein CEP51_013889 [Fusarium floridanum]|uniref:beta-glucosidase n=1 Tax=Fusarium floridanum TaxID=1325733 RepID=A0A428Q2U1_9HYPO|nr:hypothetical protein CEP51_013889 [Fusarium floridanum]
MTPPNIDQLIQELTLREKISLIAGASTWRTSGIPRLGIPNLKVSDGPSGARGEIFGEGVPAAFLPCGVSLGATWDEELLFEVGQLLASECRTKSASVSLAPTMCIHRHPLGGRNFESFSEDPFLTGKLASAHVRGVQSRGIGATPKHFVANDQETDRFKYSAEIPPRALREVYLLPFQMVVRDANPWCLMTSYNRVNGTYCDTSKELLTDILYGEWGWDGVCMSDWGGTHSCVQSINAGLTLEMPGPPASRTENKVILEAENDNVDLQQLDMSVKRILKLLEKTGRFQDAPDTPEFCDDSLENREALLNFASSGVVLLKNEGSALPLDSRAGVKKLAILGPNSKRVVAGGGGSSYIKAPYWTNIHDSIKAKLDGTATEIFHHDGAKINRYLPTMPFSLARNPLTGAPGGSIEWFLGRDFISPVVATTAVEDLYYISFGNTPKEVPGETNFSFRLRTVLTPKTSGPHALSFASIGPAKFYLDDLLLATFDGTEKSTLFFTYGSDETICKLDLIAGRDYHIRVDAHSHDRQLDPELRELMDPMEDKFQGARIGYQEHSDADFPAQAAQLAKESDIAVVVVGRDREWETEGQDIPTFELPGEQERLIRQVSAVCKRTVVVVQAGTPIKLEPWIHEVSAVLYAWYQGQELGNAVADVIFGDFNPSGRLPVTFPRRIEDCPAYSSFPGEQGKSFYSESIHVGYRWWDLLKIEPLFPIGFGLSYSTFEWSDARVEPSNLYSGSHVLLSAKVQNLEGLAGRETLIAWCREVSTARLSRPRKQICG